MNNKFLQLKHKWLEEKEFYKTNEVGTGVQGFVKKILESKELFDLKEGQLSTDPNKRKSEFIHEKKAKEQRRADFVIYINSDIVVPVEAECYGNIKAGENQLIKYQKDFDKKYGILTDGYTWRFYNNSFIIKTLSLDEILENSDLFLDFWKEYIKPEFYYLSFFETVGQLSIIEKPFHVEDDRQLFFEDITNLIRSFKNKLQIEGYLNEVEGKERVKRAVEITYAYIIQFILYKTLVDNDFDDFSKEFNESANKIYQNLKDKRYKDILGIIDNISSKISKNVYRPFAKEQEFIKEKLLDLYHSIENKLSDVSPWLDIFVFIKRYNFANVKNEIFGYIYENYLKELYGEGKKGQYFTDPTVVNFMLNQIGYTSENIKKQYESDKNSVSIIDPACGSGTFLYSATDAVIKAFDGDSEVISKKIEETVTNNIFGLDIEEFPLYLAEMSILMRMLPLIINEKYNNPIDKKIKVFKTRDSIAEFMNTALRNTINDIDVVSQKRAGQMGLFDRNLNLGYESYVRDKDDLDKMKKSLENQPKMSRYRFDYVIANPPYISYNECSKQKVLIFELMKQGKAKLNNIYGVNLHSIPTNTKKYRPNPNFYSFFISLGLSLLKDNGKLCFIIPQTILIAGDLDVLRYHLAKFTTIEKIITFSNALFIGRGLKQKTKVATSSLILLVSRRKPADFHQVKVINYKDSDEEIEKTFENIIKENKINKKFIKQHDLLVNVNNWNFIKKEQSLLEINNIYKKNTEDISCYYLHDQAIKVYKSKFFFDSGYDIDERRLLKAEPNKNCYYYPRLNKLFFSIKQIRGYWPNIRSGNSLLMIKLRQANQGYNLLDSKYKIIWSYANPDGFHYTNLPIIWARNQICAIGSNNEKELYYLFSIINSNFIKFILYSNLKNENEKNLLISTSAIKELVRVPKINKDNKFIKDMIIKKTEEMLSLEEKKLSDLIDFSNTMIQKFNAISIENNNLILKNDQEKIKLSIKENFDLVNKTINREYLKNLSLLEENQPISLSQLKNTPAIDFERQRILKDYIEDLVFCLYFNIQIPKDKLSNIEFIKQLCEGNRFYKQLTAN